MPGDAAGSSARREATFAPDPSSARLARLAVEEALRSAALPPHAIADALLVAGEMVSNAIRHARTDFTICTEINEGTLRLEVLDHDTRPPVLMGLDPASTSGRGLHLVSAVAADWGWSPAEGAGDSGKVVWATVLFDASDTRGERGG